MIPVSRLHHSFLQQANHTDSEYLSQLSVAQRDYYLNRGKDIVFEWLTSQDETNDTVRRYLAELTVRGQQLTSKVLDTREYEASYPEDFFKQKALYAKATRTGCPTSRDIIIRRPTSEKLRRALKNPNSSRIWDFEETFAIEGERGLQVYTEPGVALDIRMDYIRRLPDVAWPSGVQDGKAYIGPDGTQVTQDRNLEIDNVFFHNKMVNMAVLLAKRDLGNIQDYQSQRDIILSFDRN